MILNKNQIIKINQKKSIHSNFLHDNSWGLWGVAILKKCLYDLAQKHPIKEGRIGVALSAGADSTALLYAAHQAFGDAVVGLHVHHGLQAAADDFAQMAQWHCERLHLACYVQHVQAHPQRGQSPEDAARQHRYRALADMAHQANLSMVLLAHHAHDQAETFLLALSRGSGLLGLGGSAVFFERHGVCFARPWLTLSVHEGWQEGGVVFSPLKAHLQQQGIPWIEDPTNTTTQFMRNQIRHQVIPHLTQQWSHWTNQVMRTMQHLASGQRLLDTLAEMDSMVVGDPPQIKVLQGLDSDRLVNVLRYWIRQQTQYPPSTAQMLELERLIRACRTKGHRIDLKVSNGKVHREGGGLVFIKI